MNNVFLKGYTWGVLTVTQAKRMTKTYNKLKIIFEYLTKILMYIAKRYTLLLLVY